MTEKELRNLQIYIGKRSKNQTDEEVISHIEKINGKNPITQIEWHKLLVPCCNNGMTVILKYVLEHIDVLMGIKELMVHTVYGRNTNLDENRIEVLKELIKYLGENKTECINETMLNAAWFGETEIVRFLIAEGADRDYADSNGLNLQKCAERAATQFKDASLLEYINE